MSFSDFIHKFEDLDKFGEGGKTLHMNNHRFEAITFYKYFLHDAILSGPAISS